MIIDCISDLHGYFPTLAGGDLLILAGDYTANNKDWPEFYRWLANQPYKKKIYIGGNHDGYLAKTTSCIDASSTDDIIYLCDSGIEFEGLKIYGSPWVKSFVGMNFKCKAFTVDTEKELAEKFALIPEDIDILITHTPPFEILDQVANYSQERMENVGSVALRKTLQRVKPRYLVCGHIHECGGKQVAYENSEYITYCINASYVDEHYRPTNKPFRFEIYDK